MRDLKNVPADSRAENCTQKKQAGEDCRKEEAGVSSTRTGEPAVPGCTRGWEKKNWVGRLVILNKIGEKLDQWETE